MNETSHTILLIDDDPLVRSTCRRILEHAGYIIVATADGPTALSLLETDASAFDLIMVDLVMPGMNGAEVLESLKQMSAALPVVAMSGYGDGILTLETTSRLAGFLPKPFSASTLTGLIDGIMANGDCFNPTTCPQITHAG